MNHHQESLNQIRVIRTVDSYHSKRTSEGLKSKTVHCHICLFAHISQRLVDKVAWCLGKGLTKSAIVVPNVWNELFRPTVPRPQVPMRHERASRVGRIGRRTNAARETARVGAQGTWALHGSAPLKHQNHHRFAKSRRESKESRDPKDTRDTRESQGEHGEQRHQRHQQP